MLDDKCVVSNLDGVEANIDVGAGTIAVTGSFNTTAIINRPFYRTGG
jgi:hypothetical protein